MSIFGHDDTIVSSDFDMKVVFFCEFFVWRGWLSRVLRHGGAKVPAILPNRTTRKVYPADLFGFGRSGVRFQVVVFGNKNPALSRALGHGNVIKTLGRAVNNLVLSVL